MAGNTEGWALSVGATNAIRVYTVWGPVLGDQAMRVFVYMAIVARDGDAEPWFGLGHEALAELALGRKPSPASLRSVRRAITELHNAGAITTAKRPTNQGRHVHYRLWLSGPSPDAERPTTPVDNRPSEPVDNPPSPDAQRPVNGSVVGHFMDSRRSLSDRVVGRKVTYPIEEEGGGRGAKDFEEKSLARRTVEDRARDPPLSLPA